MPVTRHSTSDVPSPFLRVPREVIASVASALAVVIVVGVYAFVTGNAAPPLSVGTRGRTAFEGAAALPGPAVSAAIPLPGAAPATPLAVVRTPEAGSGPTSASTSAASEASPASPAASQQPPSATGLTTEVTVRGAALSAPIPVATAEAAPAPSALIEALPAPAPVSASPAPAAVATAPPVGPSTPAAVPAAAAALSVAVPPPALTDRERGLLDAMNARRAAAGLATLEPVATLTTASRTRSNDMLANNYFAHTSPLGQTWYSLLSSAGVGYSAGGENLAKVSGSVTASVTQAIEALMASPTHRANILNPAFRKVGVGTAGQADQITIFTTIFTDR